LYRNVFPVQFLRRGFPLVTGELQNINYSTKMLHHPSTEEVSLEGETNLQFYGEDEVWCVFA